MKIHNVAKTGKQDYQQGSSRYQRIIGITLLALRTVMRSHTLVALIFLLMMGVVGLPVFIRGDGTPAGQLQILLSYTLGFAFGILCLATVWSACALFAAEIDSSLIQLSVIKPVHGAELWLGKLLAIMLINFFLLTAVYLGVYLHVKWSTHIHSWSELDKPGSRHVTQPLLISPEHEALAVYSEMAKINKLPQGMSKKKILRVLAERAIDRYDIINPGDEASWSFKLQHPVKYGEFLTVRLKFDTNYSTREAVTGRCRLVANEKQDAFVDVELNDFTLNEIEFLVDTRAFNVAEKEELSDFHLSFRHTGDPASSSGVMLRYRQDVALLTPGGTFEGNLIRSALLHGTILTILAAAGLTLSTCFSFPVAAFTASLVLALLLVGSSVAKFATDDDDASFVHRTGLFVSRSVYTLVNRVTKVKPLTALVNSERIENVPLFEAVLWNILLYPLILAYLSNLFLKKRELANID